MAPGRTRSNRKGKGINGSKSREKIKGSGVWWVFINHQGERESKQIGAYKAAVKAQQMIEADIALGQWSPGREETTRSLVPTVDEYFGTFNRTYLTTAVRDSTQISYNGSFKNHISPMLGAIRMDRLTRAKVKEFVAGLVAKGLARATIRIITAELAAVFNSAIEDGIISDNPAKRLTKFYKQAPIVHEEIEPLTREEVPLFLQSVKRRSPEHYPLFLCAIHTGLRSGELAGLKWADVDFNGKFLNVRNNVVRGRRETHQDRQGAPGRCLRRAAYGTHRVAAPTERGLPQEGEERDSRAGLLESQRQRPRHAQHQEPDLLHVPGEGRPAADPFS